MLIGINSFTLQETKIQNQRTLRCENIIYTQDYLLDLLKDLNLNIQFVDDNFNQFKTIYYAEQIKYLNEVDTITIVRLLKYLVNNIKYYINLEKQFKEYKNLYLKLDVTNSILKIKDFNKLIVSVDFLLN